MSGAVGRLLSRSRLWAGRRAFFPGPDAGPVQPRKAWLHPEEGGVCRGSHPGRGGQPGRRDPVRKGTLINGGGGREGHPHLVLLTLHPRTTLSASGPPATQPQVKAASLSGEYRTVKAPEPTPWYLCAFPLPHFLLLLSRTPLGSSTSFGRAWAWGW